jgi:hypothetical protein
MASSSSGWRRGYPWATGLIAASRPGSETGPGSVRIFSSKGLAAPGTLGTFPLAQIGTPIPGTNLVYVPPRLSQDDLGGSGGSPFVGYRDPGEEGPRRSEIAGIRMSASVHRTNPEYAFFRQNRRTPSIGMGGAGQMGATMDVPFQSDPGGWFSHSVSYEFRRCRISLVRNRTLDLKTQIQPTPLSRLAPCERPLNSCLAGARAFFALFERR